MVDPATARTDTEAAIVEAAADLLRQGGPAAVTTRGVAELAGTQAPTIYRIFGDKDGLLDAVAEHVMATYVSDKAAGAAAATAADLDPLDDLVTSWRAQIDFGVANPAVFRLVSDPERALRSPAARTGRQILAARVSRLAAAGRLRVTESQAVDLIQAAGVGTIQVLLATAPEERDVTLVETMLDTVLQRILTDPPPGTSAGPVAPAVALRAQTAQLEALTSSERRLLVEWLDRIAAASAPTPTGAVSTG